MTKLKCSSINDELINKLKNELQDKIGDNDLTADELKDIIDRLIPKKRENQTGYLNEPVILSYCHQA